MMASLKRKPLPTTPQDAFASIKDLLCNVKAKLEATNDVLTAILLQDLEQITILASLFSELRSQTSHSSWTSFIDDLDSEGSCVNLWNITGLTQQMPEHEGRTLMAALRLAAFHLVEAGLERKPDIGTLLRILQLATKTASAFLELGDNGTARNVLTIAAKYEAMIDHSVDADGHRQGRATIVIGYFCSRMEAAWKENNPTMADFMSKKITDYSDYSLLGVHEKRLLAIKHQDIGKSILKLEPQQESITADAAQDAVRWLQKAFYIADHLDTSETSTADLKISILRSLARAYFLSSTRFPENLAHAEATLQELFSLVESSPNRTGTNYQELRWQKLTVLKKRSADEASLLSAYQSIIDNASFSDTTVTDILQDVRSLTSHTLISDVHYVLIERIIVDNSKAEWVDRLLLSSIYHCSKDDNHLRAMHNLTRTFTLLQDSEFDVDLVPTAACLTLLWKYGGQHFSARRWQEAAGWFTAGCHHIFQASSPTSAVKCLRKAALCHLEEGEYATAEVLLGRCPPNDAQTYFISTLIAARRGSEDDAIITATAMVHAPGFDRKLLLVITRLAHESSMKNLLLSVLERLLQTLQASNDEETVVESLAVLRCIIRLALRILIEPVEPGPNKSNLIIALVDHFSTASTLISTPAARKTMGSISKDVSWLWRTAYNAAVQGSEEWQENQEDVADLFDVSRKILEIQCQTSPTDLDTNLYSQVANAFFSAIAARVFSIRSKNATAERTRGLSMETRQCRHRIVELMTEKKVTEESDLTRMRSFIHMLCVFEAEFLAQLKDWHGLQEAVEAAIRSEGSTISTLEAIVEILWAEKDCPTTVLFVSLEATLQACLHKNLLQVDKFARWLRAVCSIALVKGTSGYKTKAIEYVEQGISVMEEHHDSDTPYPLEERQWMLGTSYNTGVECLQASHLDDAKRWLEGATTICRFLPDGHIRSAQMSDTYARLLSRCGSV